MIRDVWALMIGFLCRKAAPASLYLSILCPYVRHCDGIRDAARDLLRFSRGVFGLALLNLLFARADIFVLAKLYSLCGAGFVHDGDLSGADTHKFHHGIRLAKP